MKRLLSALFPCILLMAVLLTAFQNAGFPAEFSETELKNGIWQRSVVLQGAAAEGSGCVYGYDAEKKALVILTAGHVLTDLEYDAKALFADGVVLPVSSVRMTPDCDLGYVYLIRDEMAESEKADFEQEVQGLMMQESLQIRSSDSIQKNDIFYMPDLISEEQGLLVTGSVVDPLRYLEEFGCEMIYADGMAEEGMSGSGMFDEEGNLIGILCGATENYELAGVPAEKIQKHMQE